MNSLWFSWHQDDIPCQFSPDVAEQNAKQLRLLLGDEFIDQPVPVRERHALLKRWYNRGAVSFLELNALAADLKLLEHKPGFGSLCRDLKDVDLCLSTWHLAHTAALFERATLGSVLELVESGNSQAPDLVIDLGGERVPVEAKLMTHSQEEERFSQVAKKIVAGIQAGISGFQDVRLLVVLKSPVTADTSNSVIPYALDALSTFQGQPIEARGTACNVFIEADHSGIGVNEYHVINVLAPTPDKEHFRVLERAKKASKQLRSLPSARNSGLLVVGLTDNQHASSVFEGVGQRIRGGHYSGISGVVLTKRRVHLGKPLRHILFRVLYQWYLLVPVRS